MISLAEIKAMLKVDGDDEDGLLRALELAAVAFVQNRTGIHFGEVEPTTVYIAGSGTRRIWLPQAADGDVTITELADAGDEGTAITAADASGFVVRGAQLIRKSGVWARGYEYAVTFPRGYEPGAEPEDIRQLVVDLVAAKYKRRGKEGMKSETIGRYSYTIDDADVGSIDGAQAVIDLYRMPVVA